jgi:hypothetical protein
LLDFTEYFRDFRDVLILDPDKYPQALSAMLSKLQNKKMLSYNFRVILFYAIYSRQLRKIPIKNRYLPPFIIKTAFILLQDPDVIYQIPITLYMKNLHYPYKSIADVTVLQLTIRLSLLAFIFMVASFSFLLMIKGFIGMFR